MVQRTIDRFYPSYAEAVQVVADLTSSSVAPARVSLIESETDPRLPSGVATAGSQNPAVTGATLGAAIGAGIGVLDGIGALTIPYTDQLVATGWVLPCIALAVVGAVVGGILGAISSVLARNKSGRRIATRLQRGEHMVMVRAEEEEVALVQSIMDRRHVIPKAALATSEPLYDVPVPTVARTVGDEVDPPRQY